MRSTTERDRERAGADWVVYLLRCADDSLYCGVTNDLARRLGAHARGGVKYTRGRLPVAVAWSAPAGDRSAALRREAAIKRLPRAQKLALVSARAAAAPDCPPRSRKAPRRRSPPRRRPPARRARR